MQALQRLASSYLCSAASMPAAVTQFVRTAYSMTNRSSAKKRYTIINRATAKKHPSLLRGNPGYLHHYADVRRLKRLLPNNTKKHT